MKQFLILMLLIATYYVDIRQLNKEYCVIVVQKENSAVEDREVVKCDEIDKKDYSQWIKQIVRK